MSTVDLKFDQQQEQQQENVNAFSKLVRRISPNDIYWCNLGDINEQFNKYMIKKCRPCIILSSDTDDMQKNTFTVLPIKTFRGGEDNTYYITKKIDLGDVESLLCLDQIRPINRRSIQEYIGTLTNSQRAQIDCYIEDYLEMNVGFNVLKKVMLDYHLTPQDVIEMIITSTEEVPERTDIVDGKSCVPFNIKIAEMK